MGQVKFIPADQIDSWAAELARGHKVYAPTDENGSIVFRRLEYGVPIRLDRIPSAPPKGVVFPQTEDLVVFTSTKDKEDAGKVSVQADTPMNNEELLVLGARPCDVRSYRLLDQIFDKSIKDPYYLARRHKTVLIALGCAKPENVCFCHWVGGDPGDRSCGADVFLSPVEGGYTAEALTPAGEPLVAKFGEAKPAQVEAGAATLKAAREGMGPAPDIAKAPERFRERFGDMAFWERAVSHCISCGTCTYLCPTCSCFNITDESFGLTTRRLRTWDTCMAFLYSLEASGHNPRPSRFHRMRNRIGHKYSYHPGQNQGTYSCVGCGRCIKSCPACVDIREIVRAMVAPDAAKQE